MDDGIIGSANHKVKIDRDPVHANFRRLPRSSLASARRPGDSIPSTLTDRSLTAAMISISTRSLAPRPPSVPSRSASRPDRQPEGCAPFGVAGASPVRRPLAERRRLPLFR